MKKIIPFIFLCLLSCTVDKKAKTGSAGSDLSVIHLDSLKEMNPFVTDGKLDNCKFVKLETNDNCLISWANKIIIKDNLIFIKDNANKLFVFDMTGKFLNSIGRIGEGPDELLTMIDFYVNEKNRYVAIYDEMGSKMIKYSFDGKILSNVKCDNKILTGFSSMTFLDNGKIALSMLNGANEKFNYKIINESDYSFYKDCLALFVDKSTISSFNIVPTITSNNGQSYATSLFSDTIYKYSNGNYQPEFVLKSEFKPATSEYINRNGPYRTSTDASKYLRKDGYSTGISGIFATNDYLYFSFCVGEKWYDVYWNIPGNNGFYTLNYASKNIFVSMLYLMTTTSDAFVCMIPAIDALKSQRGKNKMEDARIDKVVNNLTAEDNPIIGFYYIKSTMGINVTKL